MITQRKELFSSQAVAASGTIRSNHFSLAAASGTLTLVLKITDATNTAVVTVRYRVGPGITDLTKASDTLRLPGTTATDGDIEDSLAANGGPQSDGEYIIGFVPTFAELMQIEVEETGGVAGATIDARIYLQ